MKKDCVICNEEFEHKNPYTKCCSLLCVNEYFMRGKVIESKIKVCKICNKKFMRNTNYRVYCSDKCRNKSRGFNRAKIMNEMKLNN